VFDVTLTFQGDLKQFLRRDIRAQSPLVRRLGEKTSVKDAIEACGVPHPEVDLILVQRAGEATSSAVDFSFQLEEPAHLEIHPVPTSPEITPLAPRLQARRFERFVADGHLGKLARDLRLLGLDTAYERDADDRRLLDIMQSENRALLTRDRRLLMHSIVRHGYCPRSCDPEEQTREVLARFSLREAPNVLVPYSRCLRCNGLIEVVDKIAVLESLADEPRTLRYYDAFRRCSHCRQIYWPGTHFDKLSARFANLLRD
jgi:uncharacterized protein with PIN domain